MGGLNETTEEYLGYVSKEEELREMLIDDIAYDLAVTRILMEKMIIMQSLVC